VLNDDPSARKGGVIGDILRWSRFATGLTTRTSAESLRVELVHPDVSEIPYAAHTCGQTPHHPGLLQQLDVRHRTGHTARHLHNHTGLLIHRHLALKGVGLFLPL
jgi:hypothetical protein